MIGGMMKNVEPFFGDYNCTYTADDGRGVKTSIPVLLELMKTIPEKPRILTMDIKVSRGQILPPNTMVISKDIAEALEQALKEGA